MYTSLDSNIRNGLDGGLTGRYSQFIQTTDGRSHGLPESQQKTNLREGFLAAGQCFGATSFAAVLCYVGFDLWGKHVLSK